MITKKLLNRIRRDRLVHQVPQALRDLDRAMQLVANKQQEDTTLAKARETLLANPGQPSAADSISTSLPEPTIARKVAVFAVRVAVLLQPRERQSRYLEEYCAALAPLSPGKWSKYARRVRVASWLGPGVGAVGAILVGALQPTPLSLILVTIAALGALPLFLITALGLIAVYSPDRSRRATAEKILNRFLTTLRPRNGSVRTRSRSRKVRSSHR